MRKILLAASMLLVAVPAMATNAVTSFTTGSVFTGFSSDETVGWKFSTASAIKVTALGWWVQNERLAASHQVGIWSSTGTLLGSTTVTPGAPTDGVWRFAAASPFTLAAGDYFIGGRDLTGDGDNYTSSVGSLTLAAGISFLGSARSSNASGFAFPSIVTANSGGRFGPNFQFSDATGAVPEPASWAMLIAGFGLVGAVARRRRVAVAA
ncbi:PEPxxWA-CTERM sorting domain-containing protein [Sandarakinorhabdus sp. AAP62]|uniref:PEPxxWA-CTERM sorting domain-containing protein n=1 Tax=Sandarakinorhabdus sp. AAP62 TaxID=1248916 RepID=UPI00187D0BB0|nr:PEPxxWA-CTERM sorting domain-containing protein [Sandarakinorhabdus sp. AAP62]